MSATAIIIGGGVIGLSTAYQLARKKFGKIILLCVKKQKSAARRLQFIF